MSEQFDAVVDREARVVASIREGFYRAVEKRGGVEFFEGIDSAAGALHRPSGE